MKKTFKTYVSLLMTCIGVASISLLVSSCKNTSSTFVQATGKPGEIMLVMENEYMNAPIGAKVYGVLTQPALSLTQDEPNFSISRVATPSFGDFLRYVRNVVIVDVDNTRFTSTALKYNYDEWAKGQIVIRLNTPSADSLSSYLDRNKAALINLLVRHELYRFGTVLEDSYSTRADELTDSLFKHRVNMPSDIKSYKVGKDFLWMSNGLARKRHDILVYSFPFKNKKDIAIDRMVEVRDSVLKANIEGGVEGSYPTTESKYNLYHRYVQTANGQIRGELRGIWKMEGGAMMSGPFVCQAYIDQKAGKVFVVEGFVYNPNEKKLTLLRMMEAGLYSFRSDNIKKFNAAEILESKTSVMQ